MSWRTFFADTVYFLKRTILSGAEADLGDEHYALGMHLSPETHLDFPEYIRIMQHQLPMLTGRELDVIWCIREGYSNEEIASALQISVSTAKTHVHNILVKTNVRSRWALRDMLIRLESGASHR